MVPKSRYSEQIYESIYLLGFLFYIFRTVFPPFKYLFLVFVLVSIVIFLKRDLSHIKNADRRHFMLPLFLILFYFLGLILSGSFYDLVLKEVLNIAVLVFYGLVFSVHFYLLGFRFFKWSTLLLIFIGIIALIRLVLIVNGIKIPFSEFFFSSQLNKLSLVSDNNFYSLYFILGIGIVLFLRIKTKITASLFFLANTVFLINIVLCFSRRGYAGLLLLLILLPLTLLRNDKKLRSTVLSFFSLVSALLILSAVSIYAFRFQIYKYDIKTGIISRNLYDLSSIYNNNDSNLQFTKGLWGRVSEEFWTKYTTEPDNLYYNGDFNYDLDFWSFTKASDDSIHHELKIEDNYKYLEISRHKGVGFFQLVYYGRPIYFHKNVKYKLNFDFRVIKGEGIPFQIGWWIIDDGHRTHNLPLKITSLENGWQSGEVIQVFKEDHNKALGFINSQQAGTLIDIRNISLTTIDSIPKFAYSDQFQENYVPGASSNQSNELFGSRAELWKYAFHLWKTKYSLTEKIFGSGFDYLPQFGQQFNDNRESHTYPHNPIISSLLYSGFVGGLYYVYFIIMVFWYYWKYRKELYPAFFMYMFALVFTMFSGNSHFSVPLFAFLSFVPFIYMIYTDNFFRSNEN